MNMDGNELSLDDLEKVSGSFRLGRPILCPLPNPRPVPGPRPSASGSAGDGDAQLGSDPGGVGDGGAGGYKGDDNYISAF